MYASHADMQDRFGAQELIDLTDRTASGALDTGVLDQALLDASAEIDGYIGGRYRLPLASTPLVLVRLCCDIARYRLYDRRAPEQLQTRYEAAVKFLEQLGSGRISLGLPDATEAGPSNNTATIQSAGSVFARDKSTGFI